MLRSARTALIVAAVWVPLAGAQTNPLDTASPTGNPLDIGGNPREAASAESLPLETIPTDMPGGRTFAIVADSRHGVQAIGSAALRFIGSQLDQRPHVQKAIVDREDRTLDSFFDATHNGKPAVGRLTVRTSGGRSAVTVSLLDGEDMPKLVALSKALSAKLPADFQPKPPIKWTDTRLPDNSGTMALPDGYKIADANQGMVNVQGPDGACAMLGIPEVIWTEASMQTAIGTRLQPFPGQLICEPCGPAEAVARLTKLRSEASQSQKPPGPAFVLDKIVEGMPIEWTPGSKAGIFLLDFSIHNRDEVRKLKILLLIACTPVDETRWLYYTSGVSAPADKFADRLPELIGIWQNWKVDQKVLLGRLLAANKTMGETTQMLIDSDTQRQTVGMKAAEAFDGYIVGSSPVVNPATGERKWIDNRQLDEELQKLNGQAGYKAWVNPANFGG